MTECPKEIEEIRSARHRRLGRLTAASAAFVLAPLAIAFGFLGSFDRRQSPWVWPAGVVSLEGTGVVGRDYVLVNPSSSALKIRVQPSCGCTTVDAPKSIPPHSLVRVGISVDTAALPFGTSSKDLVVLAEDGQRTREVKLYLSVTRQENTP